MAISFKNVGFKSDDRRFKKIESQPIPIGIKTPLELANGKSSLFKMHYQPKEQIHDNLRNLITTNYGERLGRYAYGANLASLTFDLSDIATFEQEAAFRIKDAVSKFMPVVELDNMSVQPINKINDQNTIPSGMALVKITISYNVPKIKVVNNKLQVLIYVGG
jgi:phage baseplate assembly protein W|tara:strand:+ start:171 stop:659 length:489 start_codon:yes stop_codon:yes gene_type:complete